MEQYRTILEDELQALAIKELAPAEKKKYKGWLADSKAGTAAARKRVSDLFSPIKDQPTKKVARK